MRIIIYFDLPVLTAEDRRQYTRFRKFLIKQGFIMLQKSVYSKIALNTTSADTVKKTVERHKPSSGNIQILTVTERQFQDIEVIVGESQKEILDTLDRFVVI